MKKMRMRFAFTAKENGWHQKKRRKNLGLDADVLPETLSCFWSR